MDFEKAFPLRFWINLGRREDRRIRTETVLEKAGVSAERFPAVSDRWVRTPRNHKISEPVEIRGYESAGRYALALTQRMAIREAKQRKAPAVLLLEDDVILHPNFKALIAGTELPDDWGIFYLGCTHCQAPKWAGTRVVRTSYSVDTHAVAIRDTYYNKVIRILNRHGKPGEGVSKASDQFLALLHREIPSYACYPNLAWQARDESDLTGINYTNYHGDGLQKNYPHAIEGLIDAPFQTGSTGNKRVKLGLLFLTLEDVNHPEIWREFVAEAPDSIRVFSHPKFPERISGGLLEGTAINDRVDTKWGDISLVRATRAMLLEALKDESITHFALVSENCVPVKPLPDILKRLELDPRSQFDFRPPNPNSSLHAHRVSGAPVIPEECWRFTSQWWMINRTAAIIASQNDFTAVFEKVFAADEGYFATILALQGYPLLGQVLPQKSTWTYWEKKASHPKAWLELPREQLDSIIHSRSFFARKFPKGADIGKYGLHRSGRMIR